MKEGVWALSELVFPISFSLVQYGIELSPVCSQRTLPFGVRWPQLVGVVLLLLEGPALKTNFLFVFAPLSCHLQSPRRRVVALRLAVAVRVRRAAGVRARGGLQSALSW